MFLDLFTLLHFTSVWELHLNIGNPPNPPSIGSGKSALPKFIAGGGNAKFVGRFPLWIVLAAVFLPLSIVLEPSALKNVAFSRGGWTRRFVPRAKPAEKRLVKGSGGGLRLLVWARTTAVRGRNLCSWPVWPVRNEWLLGNWLLDMVWTRGLFLRIKFDCLLCCCGLTTGCDAVCCLCGNCCLPCTSCCLFWFWTDLSGSLCMFTLGCLGWFECCVLIGWLLRFTGLTFCWVSGDSLRVNSRTLLLFIFVSCKSERVWLLSGFMSTRNPLGVCRRILDRRLVGMIIAVLLVGNLIGTLVTFKAGFCLISEDCIFPLASVLEPFTADALPAGAFCICKFSSGITTLLPLSNWSRLGTVCLLVPSCAILAIFCLLLVPSCAIFSKLLRLVVGGLLEGPVLVIGALHATRMLSAKGTARVSAKMSESIFKTNHATSKFSRWVTDDYFLIFPCK